MATAILEQLDTQGAFFDVHEEAVKTASGATIPGKKVIVHENGTPLGIVSKKYKTATNTEIFTEFDRALQKSGLDLTGATVRVDFANGGARTLVHMDFPAHEISVNGSDKSMLSIVTRNSYDGRWNFSVRGGAVRYACLNGMLLGDWLAGYSEYHNAKLSIAHAADKVSSVLGAFNDTTLAWEKMLASPVTDEQAWRAICRYNANETGFKGGIKSFREAPRQTVSTTMMEQFEYKEKKTIGPNAFAVYNTLTHHATHAKLKDGKEAVSKDLRAKRVADVINSKYWTERVVAVSA